KLPVSPVRSTTGRSSLPSPFMELANDSMLRLRPPARMTSGERAKLARLTPPQLAGHTPRRLASGADVASGTGTAGAVVEQDCSATCGLSCGPVMPGLTRTRAEMETRRVSVWTASL